MKAYAPLLALLAAAAMTACGGGSDYSAPTTDAKIGGTTGGTTSGTTNDPASVTTNYLAYSSLGSGNSSLATSTKTAGSSTMTIGSESATVTGSDASGNFTEINGSFTKVIAFSGNAIGQLCVGGANGVKGVYSFVLANAEDATLSDLRGKTFVEYSDCARGQTMTLNNDGSATLSGEAPAPASEVDALFSAAGFAWTDPGIQGVTKAKAFKITSNGIVRIGIVMVDSETNTNTNGKTGATVIFIQE